MKVLATLSRTFYNAYPVFNLDKRCKDWDIELILTDDQPLSKQEVINRIKDKNIYVVTTEIIDKEVIESAENLQLIIKYGVGVDNIDLTFAASIGIPVTNAPGQNAKSVADLTIGLLLSAARMIPQVYQLVKKDQWKLAIGYELGNKVLGILGFGSIGKEVAIRARGFGMKMIAYDHFHDEKNATELGVEYKDLKSVLQESDFICLHLALTDDTYHLINQKTIKLLKTTAFIINTSRGTVIDEQAIITALVEKKIAGAALDVFEQEPANRALVELENVIATPHIGGSTFEASKRIGDITVNNIIKYSRPDDLSFVINRVNR